MSFVLHRNALALSLTDLLIPGCTESGWILFSNSCYLFSSDTMNWTKAKDHCEEKGALLLKIEDASEREWVRNTHHTHTHTHTHLLPSLKPSIQTFSDSFISLPSNLLPIQPNHKNTGLVLLTRTQGSGDGRMTLLTQ